MHLNFALQVIVFPYHMSSLFSNHDAWDVGVARGQGGHDGGVRHPQPRHASDTQSLVDDRPLGVVLGAHPAGPHVVVHVVGEVTRHTLPVSVTKNLQNKM